ncbi:GFA family protein [Aquamicrobium sp. LC103]|uniref:GFA family protein n=1 Tax=Aquamicrobium sp. LC103 TaxID=1120658 RepID=UPI00063EB38C|nr:GFA family protein [Aquamicrobium sp. LC103]TKT76757.1 GFA family protein [Aquamicrobium sp. LC103]
MPSAAITGGCLCGSVRYRCDEPYRYAVHCHCSMCRKSSGAAFMTWVCLPREAFRLTAGTPRPRRSSATAQRAFCPDCGAQIYMDYRGSGTIDVSVGTLDDAGSVTALDNIWVEERLPLMKGFDGDLPEHRQFSPRS